LIFVFELKPHPATTGFIGDGKGSLIIMPAVQIVKKLQFMAKPLSFLNSLSENQCKLKCQFFIFVASIEAGGRSYLLEYTLALFRLIRWFLGFIRPNGLNA
jgi:hypothetical protein